MFNLFKKQNPTKPVDEKSQESIMINVAGYPKEVLEIHHEFQNAAENLLKEAKNIIQEAASKDTDKVNRLESLGFKQANQVTELRPLIQKAEMSKEQIQLLNHYQLNYPNNKFITEGQVKSICYKYNLVCGDVSRFKGFVPEKNLKEIEVFSLKEKDKLDTSKSIYFVTTERFNDVWQITDIKESDMELTHVKYLKNSYHFVKYMCPDLANSYAEGAKIVSHFAEPKLLNDVIGLKICAPVKDMDLTDLELSEGYKLKSKIHVPDPIVLQPVNGGYLILTAWGDEASDELVFNQKFN